MKFTATPQTIGSVLSKVVADTKTKTIKACQATVNIQAAETRKNAIENINNNFTIRNNFTTRNVTYKQCPKNVTKLDDIQSQVGATERIEYMKRQETGGTRKSDNGSAPLAIPTTKARGGSNSKQVQSKYRLNKMKTVKYLGGNRSFVSRKAHFVAMAQVAATKNMLLNFKKGIYEVMNFTSTNGKVSFTLNLIRNKAYTQTQTPSKPWLEPAMEQPARDGQQIFNQQMAKV